MNFRLLPTLHTFAVAAFVAAGMPASADVIALNANLKGTSEVPPNQSKGAGSVAVTYDTADKTLSWKGSYSGLSGAVTAAHFHGPAAVGRNAGIMVSIAISGTSGTFEGSATISDAQAADLLAGRWYVNLHTAANPAGEIRGQVLK
jgi:hypothetical protein